MKHGAPNVMVVATIATFCFFVPSIGTPDAIQATRHPKNPHGDANTKAGAHIIINVTAIIINKLFMIDLQFSASSTDFIPT